MAWPETHREGIITVASGNLPHVHRFRSVGHLSMNTDELTLKFVNMDQALMFRAALQTLADFIPQVDEAIREFTHSDTVPADKGQIDI